MVCVATRVQANIYWPVIYDSVVTESLLERRTICGIKEKELQKLVLDRVSSDNQPLRAPMQRAADGTSLVLPLLLLYWQGFAADSLLRHPQSDRHFDTHV
jgi:hypothetical protein